jgi:hypothetical protein
MNRIKARLKNTSQSWIASIILVLNLVKLAGIALVCLSFSASTRKRRIAHVHLYITSAYLKSKTQSRYDSGLGFDAYAA